MKIWLVMEQHSHKERVFGKAETVAGFITTELAVKDMLKRAEDYSLALRGKCQIHRTVNSWPAKKDPRFGLAIQQVSVISDDRVDTRNFFVTALEIQGSALEALAGVSE